MIFSFKILSHIIIQKGNKEEIPQAKAFGMTTILRGQQPPSILPKNTSKNCQSEERSDEDSPPNGGGTPSSNS
ncbi:hypothetical protein, partial [Caldisericum sp.]|uniref:hypothetical protein n=1 Tax=Caldisericum sp. TaxID=2499687 RepID=UPI003D11E8C3